jgi:endoglycosylceramidase
MVDPPLFLHVVHPQNGVPYLADPLGRRIILRGVAASGFEDQAYAGAQGTRPQYPYDPAAYEGRCPANTGRSPAPPLCELHASLPAPVQPWSPGSEDDFAQMRALGFDLVRLTINWSELEPRPGQYSSAFLRRVSQVVDWADQQHLYVILDMHQDGYSRFLSLASAGVPDPPACTPSDGQDGAPFWATVTDHQPSCAFFGQSQFNPAMAAAFENFWQDDRLGSNGAPIPQGSSPGPGLQDHFIGALGFLARHFENDPAVLGYELMNEPLPGPADQVSIPVSNLYDFSDRYLFPFYRRAVEALTGVRDGLATCPRRDPMGARSSCAPRPIAQVSHQQILFEPTGFTDTFDFAPQHSRPFTSYPNLVYSPHVYTHVFTIDTISGGSDTYPPSYTFGYANAMADASAMHAALLVTEYGDAPADDGTILRSMTAAQEESLSGSVFWTWKENCGSSSTKNCTNGWGVYYPPSQVGGVPVAQNGPLDTARVALLERAWPVATEGELVGYRFDPSSGGFFMKARASAASVVPTLVYLPPDDRQPVTVSGRARLVAVRNLPNGARLVSVQPTDRGEYALTVGQAPSLPSPLSPIRGTAALDAFEAWAFVQRSVVVTLANSLLLGR